MIRKLLFFTLSVYLFLYHPLWANQEKETNATKAANEWLSIIDGGNYADSWDDTATYFQNSVPKNKWEEILIAVRKPLGEVISRKVKSQKFTTQLPDVPNGEYVVIQYETSFKNKVSAVETVVPELCSDGAWRVSGYFVK